MNKVNENVKIGILGNFKKDKFYQIFDELGNFLESNNISFYLLENDRIDLKQISYKDRVCNFDHIIKKANIILSIGGDGTIISSIRKFLKYNKPILGLHIGGLGFLAECNNENYKKDADKFIESLNNLDIKPPKKYKRKCPKLPAKLFELGTIEISNGDTYEVVEYNRQGNKFKKWKKL